jgi:hypothetical protein
MTKECTTCRRIKTKMTPLECLLTHPGTRPPMDGLKFWLKIILALGLPLNKLSTMDIELLRLIIYHSISLNLSQMIMLFKITGKLRKMAPRSKAILFWKAWIRHGIIWMSAIQRPRTKPKIIHIPRGFLAAGTITLPIVRTARSIRFKNHSSTFKSSALSKMDRQEQLGPLGTGK